MHAVRFKADLSAWQTSSIVNAAESFFGAFSFNGDVSQWDVRNLMDLTKMVCREYALSLDFAPHYLLQLTPSCLNVLIILV